LIQAYFDDLDAIRARHEKLGPPSTTGEELDRMIALDQFALLAIVRISRLSKADASGGLTLSAVADNNDAILRTNTDRIKVLLGSRDWFDDRVDGRRATYNAWLIVQHSDHDPAFQREMLVRLAPLAGSPRLRSEDYALLFDRVALKDGRPQRYASQLACDEGRRIPKGQVEDPAHLDERRMSVGLDAWLNYVAMMDRNFGACPGS
jgi:hypothetical protein